MKKGFSLIELLVSLIIISLILAAFTPLITKKLKASETTVGSFGTATGSFLPTVDTCEAGYHLYQKECYPDIPYCKTYEYGSVCSECKEGYSLEGALCAADCTCENGSCSAGTAYCTSCNEGYTLYNNQCVEGSETECYDFFCDKCTDKQYDACTVCKDGYVLHDGKCYFGTLKGCNNPTYDDTYQVVTCESCLDGYTKCNSGSCALTTNVSKSCPGNTIKVGCTCVTQYNIGEGRYSAMGEDLSAVKVCTAGSSCSVTNGTNTTATARTLEAACWKGRTANNYTDITGYSGYNRTVCNWTGGYELCKNMKWRMPTYPELIVIASASYSSSTLSYNGLMFCSSGSVSGIDRCELYTNCTGTCDAGCRPSNLWSQSFNGASYPRRRYCNTGWSDGRDSICQGESVRCVKDL